jgi:elongator complex protein 3 (tRNA carboxymethyluridine synthase)
LEDSRINGTKAAYDSGYAAACISIATQIQSKASLSQKSIMKIVRQTAANHRLSTLPRNQDIVEQLDTLSPYRKLLMVKPVKTRSGVLVITVMPKPYECPHGRCVYCPGGIPVNTPLSYTGQEPVTKVAQKFAYNPYEQIRSRLTQLCSMGHDAGKVELVVVGGTFPFMPEQYQRDFVKSCFAGLNSHEYDKIRSFTLTEAMKMNETARSRCVGLTIETKPDYCKERHIDLMLEIGVTRVELGVQCLQEDVYRAVNRGHDLSDVKDSFRVARDSGLKIVAHMMPGLPKSSPEKDISDFYSLFDNPSYRPDMLKIYPTVVIKGTPLYELYKCGKYIPYTNDDFVKILIAVKKRVPHWIRIMRVQREIEPSLIIAGPSSGNMRQIVLGILRADGQRCHCIRCREHGLLKNSMEPTKEVALNRIEYPAGSGLEVFLSFETEDRLKILGFLRLRIAKNPHRKELKDEQDASAVVRELHIYGRMLNVGDGTESASSQHRGFGAQLMFEAERITREEHGLRKLSVISAVGTREYYRKLGYQMNGPYMSKAI